MAFLTLPLARSQRGAAEPIERRAAAAGVLLHQVEPLHRDEQLVVALVAQLQELVRGVADADLLEPDELADAVVDVDDEVADLEVAQVGEERRRQRSLARRAAAMAVLLEDVGFGVERDRRLRQPEAAAQRAHRHQHRARRHLAGAGGQFGAHVVVGQHLDGALGAAGRLGDEHDRVAAGATLAHFVHPVGDAAVEALAGLRGHVPQRRVLQSGASPST